MLITQNKKSTAFKQAGIFNTAAAVESNILLNKGITDIGGFVVPQAIMSNNKDESFERVFKSMLYFVFTFVSPFVLLPLINKHSLKSNKIINDFTGEQKKILEVPKKYLTKGVKEMKEGIEKTAEKLFNDKTKFNPTLDKYSNPEELRQKLINAHSKILFTDFLTTNLMVASIPWLGNMLTKYRTNRSGYSGTYNMADEEFTQKAAEKHDRTKKIRQAATLGLAVLPALTIPALLKKGMLKGTDNNTNKILNWFNKNASEFDYKESVFMSRLTAMIMWLTSDYFPYQLACRDKYEYRDTVIRGTSIGLVFWGGDLFLKNAFSNFSDRVFNTKLMNKAEKRPYRLSELKNAQNFDELKKLPYNVLNKTKKAAVGLYAFNLAIVMSVLGFGLPYALNKLLKTKVSQDKAELNNKLLVDNRYILNLDNRFGFFNLLNQKH